MHKESHVYVKITPEYRNFRNAQTLLNRFVWSTELCYSYFLDVFEADKNSLNISTADLFAHLPIQAWYKNDSGTGKYSLKLREHNDIIQANQTNICRSAIIINNSHFEDYLSSRLKKDFLLSCNLNFNTKQIGDDKARITLLKKILKADLCRLIRNDLVHRLGNNFIDIKRYKDQKKESFFGILQKCKKDSFLFKNYSPREIDIEFSQAIHEVIDTATKEINIAKQSRNVDLPYEYFFMLYTFTNYDEIAFEIEQALYHDHKPKTEYNRVDKQKIKKELEVMIAEPSVTGFVTDIHTHMPINKAEIRVKNNPACGESDKKGFYYLTPNIPDGPNSLEISAFGYQSKTTGIITQKNKAIVLNIELKPQG